MNSIRFSALVILFAVLNTGFPARFPAAKITVSVTDQDNVTLEGASIGVAGTLEPREGELARGFTNAAGIFSAEIATSGEVAVTARKAGYYDTRGRGYNFRSLPGIYERAAATGRWNSNNTLITVVLKRIISPTPMYAAQIRKGLPTADRAVGFDLTAADFVAPYGKGETTDLVFKIASIERNKNDYDHTLSVSFANQLDGIVAFEPDEYLHGSVLRSPHQAPESGYKSQWVVTRSRKPGAAEVSNYNPEKHAYFFRTRTITDSDGKIISTNYGKIYGDFMNFTYYFNPTPNDRNVEFDPKRNLFTNLKPLEQVTAP